MSQLCERDRQTYRHTCTDRHTGTGGESLRTGGLGSGAIQHLEVRGWEDPTNETEEQQPWGEGEYHMLEAKCTFRKAGCDR